MAAVDCGVDIRAVQPGELGSVQAIEQVSFRNPWPLHIFEQELTHSWSRLWGAFQPGGSPSLIGYLLFWLVYDEVHILNIATHPDHRRRLIARSLLKRLEDEARRIEARFLTLEVRMSNSAAIGLYEAEGYDVVGRRPRYYTDNAEDALVMMKHL